MKNFDFLICPVLYLASACFLASEALPRCLAKSSPRPGRVSCRHQRHLPQCSARCGTEAGLSIFPGFYSQFPWPSPKPVEQGCGTGVHKQHGAGLCFPALCVGGGCRAPLQGWPCPWPPGEEPGEPGFAWAGLGILLLLPWGEDLLPALAAVPGCLLSYRGQAGSCALHSCAHGQGCDTSIGSTHLGASSSWCLEQLQHCSHLPVVQDLITGSQPQGPSSISKGIQLPGSQETLSENGIPQVYRHRHRL